MRPARAWLVPAAGAAAVASFRLVLAAGSTVPHLFPDEIGYLGAARRVAGAAPDLSLGPAPTYHPLYGALLAPVFAFDPSPAAAYRAVLVVNALLGAATTLLLYRCCRRILGADPTVALLAAVTAGLFAGQSMHGVTAWAENLLPAGVLLWVLAVHRAATARSVSLADAALVVVAALATYWAHPRGVLLVAVTAAASLVAGVARRATVPAGVAAAAALACGLGFVASRWGIERLLDPLYDTPAAGSEEAGALGRLVDPGRWGDIAARLLGEAWYQALATAGLVTIGVLDVVRRARRREAVLAPVLLLVAAAGLAVVAGSYLAAGGRTDTLFYGRYVDAIMPLFTAAGVVALFRPGAGAADRVRAFAEAAGVALALTAAMLVVVGDLDPTRPFVGEMVLGLLGHASLVDRLEIGPIAAVAVGVLLAAGLAAWRSAVAGVAVLAAAFVVLAIEADDRLARFVDVAATLEVLADDAADRAGGEPVGVELASALDLDLGLYGYQWFRPDLAAYDARGLDRPRSPWAIGPLRWDDARDRGATLVRVDPSQAIGLWVLPGREADDLRRRGETLPDDWPAELPDEAVAAEITGPSSVRAAAGATVTVEVGVAHRGAGARWPRFEPAGAGQLLGRVRVGARVWPADADRAGEPVAAAVADLPTDVVPGDRVTVDLDLDLRSVPAGRYLVVVDLAQAGMTWFEDRGGEPLLVDLTVEG